MSDWKQPRLRNGEYTFGRKAKTPAMSGVAADPYSDDPAETADLYEDARTDYMRIHFPDGVYEGPVKTRIDLLQGAYVLAPDGREALIATPGGLQPDDGQQIIDSEYLDERTQLRYMEENGDQDNIRRLLSRTSDDKTVADGMVNHDPATFEAIASNPNLKNLMSTPDVLVNEFRRGSEGRQRVLTALANNPNGITSMSDAHQMIDYINNSGLTDEEKIGIYYKWANNPEANRDTFCAIISQTHDARVLRSIATNPHSRDDNLSYLVLHSNDEQTKQLALENPHSGEGTASAVVETTVDPMLRRTALNHPYCPQSMVEDAALYGDQLTQVAVASNPKLKGPVLEHLAIIADRNTDMRRAYAANPNADPQRLAEYADADDYETDRNLAGNKNTSHDTMIRITDRYMNLYADTTSRREEARDVLTRLGNNPRAPFGYLATYRRFLETH